MPKEVWRSPKLVLDNLELYKSKGSFSAGSGQNKIIPLPGADNPKTIEKYSDVLSEKLGPDMVKFFSMGKEMKIVGGPRDGQSIIDNIHAVVTKVEGVVDVVSFRFRMYDRVVDLSGINLEMPFLQAEITIADWDTYEQNRNSSAANKIDPASVIMPGTYNESFESDFRDMMVNFLPIVGLYTVVPYDKVRARFFRPYIMNVNALRSMKAAQLGVSDEDYVPIQLEEPKVDSPRALRDLRM